MSWVGRPIPRLEDPALVTGRGRFVADFVAGAAALHFVRSPIGCGRIVKISRPNGATVLTATDLARVRPIRPLLHRPDYVAVEQPVLAGDRVRYVGEPVAAVIAASAAEAEDLAELVVVELEPEDAVVDVDAALAPGAPLVFEELGDNVAAHITQRVGQPERTFATADHTIRESFRVMRGGSHSMEGRGVVARYDEALDGFTVWDATQMPHGIRAILEGLDRPEEGIEAAASAWNGHLALRMLGPAVGPLRERIARFTVTYRGLPMPRVWQT